MAEFCIVLGLCIQVVESFCCVIFFVVKVLVCLKFYIKGLLDFFLQIQRQVFFGCLFYNECEELGVDVLVFLVVIGFGGEFGLFQGIFFQLLFVVVLGYRCKGVEIVIFIVVQFVMYVEQVFDSQVVELFVFVFQFGQVLCYGVVYICYGVFLNGKIYKGGDK